MGNFECPLCGTTSANGRDYAEHLASAHGLTDDEGTATDAIEPSRPIAPIEPEPVFSYPIPAAPPTAPGTPPPPMPPPPMPPPPMPPPASPTLPPPPPPTGERTVPMPYVAGAIAAIIIVAIGAMVLVSRGGGSQPAEVSAGAIVTTSTTPASSSSPGTQPIVGTPTTAGVSVDPAEARTVAQQLWAIRNAAVHDRDLHALSVIDIGPALEADVGAVCNLGCPPPAKSQAGRIMVNVPRQTTWPATFLAVVQWPTNCLAPAGEVCTDAFVARQDSQGTPWRITVVVDYLNSTNSRMMTTASPTNDGFALPGPTGEPYASLPADYATYLATIKDTGQPPAGNTFAPGGFTTDLIATNYSPNHKSLSGNNEVVDYRADAPDTLSTFALDDSTTVTCGNVMYTSTLTPPPGLSLVQPPSRTEYTAALAPGSYSQVVEHGVHNVCFVTSTADPQVYVEGSWGGEYEATGTP